MKTGVGADAETGEPFWFFEYKTRFYDPPIRVEWEADTMATVLPQAVADSLINNNYARVMNGAEVRAYNRGLGKPKEDQL